MAKSDKQSMLRQFGDNVSAKNVLDAAKAGDEMALEVMKTVSHYLGPVSYTHLDVYKRQKVDILNHIIDHQ